MPSSIQLVPPTLKVVAAIMTNQIEVSRWVTRLTDRLLFDMSFAQLKEAKLPPVRCATENIGHGLVLTLTQSWDDGYRSIVWLAEISCHPLCSFFGRECCGNLNGINWLEKIEKKHHEMLDSLPSV